MDVFDTWKREALETGVLDGAGIVLVAFTFDDWEALVASLPRPLPERVALRDVEVWGARMRATGKTRLHSNRWFAKRWGWRPSRADALGMHLRWRNAALDRERQKPG